MLIYLGILKLTIIHFQLTCYFLNCSLRKPKKVLQLHPHIFWGSRLEKCINTIPEVLMSHNILSFKELLILSLPEVFLFIVDKCIDSILRATVIIVLVSHGVFIAIIILPLISKKSLRKQTFVALVNFIDQALYLFFKVKSLRGLVFVRRNFLLRNNLFLKS